MPFLLLVILHAAPATPELGRFDPASELVVIDGYPGDPGYVEEHVERASGLRRYVVPIVITLEPSSRFEERIGEVAPGGGAPAS